MIGAWTVQAEIESQGRTISDRSHNVTDMGIPVTVGIGKELGPSACGTVNHFPACHDFMLELGVGEAWQRRVIDRMSAQVDARTKRVADPLPVCGSVYGRPIPPERGIAAGGVGDEEHSRGNTERVQNRHRLFEHAGVTVVEGHCREGTKGGSTRQPVDELAQRHHIVVGDEPTHLSLKPLSRLMKSQRIDAIPGRDHIVIAENEARILPSPAECGDPDRPKRPVVGIREETHDKSGVNSAMRLLDTPRRIQDLRTSLKPLRSRSFRISLRETGWRTPPGGTRLSRALTR